MYDIRKAELPLYEALYGQLTHYQATNPAEGIKNEAARDVLARQMIDSIRRTRFVSAVAARPISPLRADPSSDLFDPVRAAILKRRHGNHDEACWLIFLSVHFGKSLKGGWRLARDVYGGLGDTNWTWDRTSTHVSEFRDWLSERGPILAGADGIKRGFGNHRKYESLKAHSASGTGEVVQTYVAWVGPSHTYRFEEALTAAGGDPKGGFDRLYRSLHTVARFGRTAKFDYLTMTGKVGLADIQPAFAYLSEATGPLRGARLLVTGSEKANLSAASLESSLAKLDETLNVGMQVLEDSLCNWQKSPLQYLRFFG